MATELELDQTENPTALVAGDPSTLASTTAHMSKLGGAFERTAGGLRRIDLGEWTGEAADAFRASFKESPKGWADAADAFGRAARALDGFRSTVVWAQEQAGQAVALYRNGMDASVRARSDYNRQVDEYNAAATGNGPPPAPLPPFTDPGQGAMERAQQMLAAARSGRDTAAADVTRVLTEATALAPPLPSGWDRLGADLLDGAGAKLTEFNHMLQGVGEGIEGLVKLVRTVNPGDPYNITHPAQYLDNLTTVTAGLIHTAAHPIDMVKDITGTGWGSDPAKAAGRLIPNILLGIATAGGGTAAKVAGGAARREAAAAAERGAPTAAREAEAHPIPAPTPPPGGTPPPLQRDVPLPDTKTRRDDFIGEEDPADPDRWNAPQVLHVMDPAELEQHRLFVQDGKLFQVGTGQPFDTSAARTWDGPTGRAMFVMDEHGNIFASLEQERHTLHHSSFFGGGPVAGAGEIQAVDGVPTVVTRRSGHYSPDLTHFQQVMRVLQEQGFDVSRITFTDGF